MRVLLTITLSERGGAQKNVNDLARALIRRGHEVHLATGSSGALVDDAAEEGVRVHLLRDLVRELDPRRDVAAVRAMFALIRRVGPDLVHAHSSKAGAVARLAAAAARVPSLYTAHGFVFLEPLSRPRRAAYVAVELAGGRVGARLIAVSERDAAAARRYRLAPARRIVTIPNGYDPPSPPRPLPPSSPFRFAVVANAYPTKGLHVLVDALRRLDPAPGLQVVVAGDGPDRPGLERAARGLPVEWLGRVDDVSGVLDGAHALVLPSLKEGWPYAVLEAMGAGRAVVASDVGGIPDQLGGDEAGWVVPPGDSGALARTLRAVADDPAEAAARGARGAQRVRALFPVDRMVDAVVEQYEEAVRDRRRRR